MLKLFDIEVDYEKDYVKDYHGTMSEATFESSLLDAQAEVDYAIWPGADLTEHECNVKMAICAVADIIGNPKIRRKSYTAGKVSESFSTAGFALTSSAAIKRWLGNTNVLKHGRWL